ncbi:hypothetical protein S245_055409, partial [Arachis hypogaea]
PRERLAPQEPFVTKSSRKRSPSGASLLPFYTTTLALRRSSFLVFHSCKKNRLKISGQEAAQGKFNTVKPLKKEVPKPEKLSYVIPLYFQANETNRNERGGTTVTYKIWRPRTPRICMKEEPTEVPINRATRFENKVEFLDLVASESLIKKRILERFFIDLVAGESLIKEQAATRFNDKGFTLSVSPHFTRYIRASTPLSSKRSIGGASPPCTAVALNFRHTEAPSHPSRLFVCCTRRFVSNPNVQRAAVVLVLEAHDKSRSVTKAPAMK